jgi:hypothetical protein
VWLAAPERRGRLAGLVRLASDDRARELAKLVADAGEAAGEPYVDSPGG